MTLDDSTSVLRALVAALENGEPVALATVVSSERSTPRHAGSKMLVRVDGSTIGSVGGGEMEARVIGEARAALRERQPRLLHYQLVDPGRGDPGVCGGEVQVYVEPYPGVATVLVVGGGHVGRAVAELAHWLGFRVVVTDDRPDQVRGDAFPDADVLLPGPLDDALTAEPVTADTHVVVVNRDMGVDVAVLPRLLATPAASIGVIGSARRWSRTRQALEAQGVDPARLDRVSAPIGLDLGSETPAEIALSILAEIVALRRGGHGGFLRG